MASKTARCNVDGALWDACQELDTAQGSARLVPSILSGLVSTVLRPAADVRVVYTSSLCLAP